METDQVPDSDLIRPQQYPLTPDQEVGDDVSRETETTPLPIFPLTEPPDDEPPDDGPPQRHERPIPSKMTTEQYRTAIIGLGARSTKDASALLGVSVRQAQYYASGRTSIPDPIDLLLGALISLHSARDLIAALQATSDGHRLLPSLYTFGKAPGRSPPIPC